MKPRFALITIAAGATFAFCASCTSPSPDIYIINETPRTTTTKKPATTTVPPKATPQTSWKSNPETIEPITAPQTFSP